jgi:N-acyl-D-amino-acid deacylase
VAGPDLLLRGGTVVDGSGSAGRRADVLISGGVIASVAASIARPEGTRVIDVGGLTVAPGFIDLHSHSDFTFPAFPDSAGQVTQGVTSELVGHCGDTPAPLAADPERRQQAITSGLGAGPDLDWSWGGFASFMDVLDAARPAVNCLPLVGHNALRIFALGMAERAPSAAELGLMRDALREGLAAGAWGMSTGLAYAPGQWAATDDIVAVASPLAEFNGIYASHIRNESDDLVAAVAEALAIGERLGVPVEVSHLKAAGAQNFGRTRDALGLIAEAAASGRTATCDMYPYEAGSTYLAQLFPPWVFDGGTDAMLERIASAEVRARIRADVERGLPSWGNLLGAAGSWDRVLINGVVEPAAEWARGRYVSELAAERGLDGLDLACELLRMDRGATTMAIFMLSLGDVREVLASPRSGVGSDLYAVTSAGAANHPRCSGSFARLLRWSREGLLPLEEAVRKLTSLPASTIGLRDRGRIEAGLVADIAAFDAQTVTDNATWEDASALASGVEHVLIGGEPAVERGRPVNLRLGRVLRRPRRA